MRRNVTEGALSSASAVSVMSLFNGIGQLPTSKHSLRQSDDIGSSPCVGTLIEHEVLWLVVRPAVYVSNLVHGPPRQPQPAPTRSTASRGHGRLFPPHGL